MNKHTAPLIAVAFVMWSSGMASALAAGSNLLVNASFENGYDTSITSWPGAGADGATREQSGTFGYTLGPNTFPNGTYALKLFAKNAGISQGPIPVKPEQAYVIAGRFYHSSQQDVIAASSQSLRGYFHIEWFDATGTSLRHDYTVNHNGTSPADQWVEIRQDLFSPPAAATAIIHVQADSDEGGGSLFVDTVSFAEGE